MKDNSHDKSLRDWVRWKQSLRAPEDLADRLMPATAAAQPSGLPGTRWACVIPFARAAVFILALAGGLSRYAVLVVCLFGN